MFEYVVRQVKSKSVIFTNKLHSLGATLALDVMLTSTMKLVDRANT